MTEEAICFRTERKFARPHDPQRLLPRFYLNPKPLVTDASYLQLLLEERFAMAYPGQTAEISRAAFRD